MNRVQLTPLIRQKLDDRATRTALRRIQTNTVLEAATGLLVVVIVGLLGTISPSLWQLIRGSAGLSLSEA
ncbi:MAG TPA: hypothetical protein VNH84_12650, partial [Candidatus Saccharimonadales bacterium]|nr:hypothetical protein [Candidatus Saccharimonadales bacterium]